jgi:hypothetical protein
MGTVYWQMVLQQRWMLVLQRCVSHILRELHAGCCICY